MNLATMAACAACWSRRELEVVIESLSTGDDAAARVRRGRPSRGERRLGARGAAGLRQPRHCARHVASAVITDVRRLRKPPPRGKHRSAARDRTSRSSRFSITGTGHDPRWAAVAGFTRPVTRRSDFVTPVLDLGIRL